MTVLTYEKKERVAYITLNRPEKMNALNTALLDELEAAWQDFNNDDEVWVALVTGAGRAFCVGADFESIGEPGLQVGFNVPREDPSVNGVGKPVIAAINGAVIGRGLALMLGCDIRLMADTATISIPEAKFGVIPGDTNVLEQNIPTAIAREMFFTGNSITAQRAYEIGLVNRVVKPEELMAEATAMAQKIAGNSPLVLQAIKQMFTRGQDMDFRTAVSIYRQVNGRVSRSADYKEGMASLREKRKPDWQGK